MSIPASYFWFMVLPAFAGVTIILFAHRSLAVHPQEFRWWRAAALHFGSLFVNSPLLLLSWSLLYSHTTASAACFLAGLVLSMYVPSIVVYFFRRQRLIPVPPNNALQRTEAGGTSSLHP